MVQTYWIALAWLFGLLSRSLWWGWLWILAIAAIAAVSHIRKPRLARTYIAAGLIGCLAWAYIGLRTPTPSPFDISTRAPQPNATVVGQVETVPRQTRSGRQQLWLRTENYRSPHRSGSAIASRLYVTYPLQEELPNLLPGQRLELTGFLYRPSGAQNPGGFDFQAYLARHNAFAGLSARQVAIVDPDVQWGGWLLRQRIVDAFVAGLGDRLGALLGALVLGSAASQVPFDLQDAFREVGLAHTIAASGFHVALLLGIVLAIARSRPVRQQQVIAIASLLAYVTLTGGSPSAWRATIAGVAVALSQELETTGRRLQPLGFLLATAVLLTLFNPLWIRDLGFQLSFAATAGLLVSARPIQTCLEFLPPAIAQAIATPLAATLWTLPLQLAVFGKVSTYFLVAALLTSPLTIAAVAAGMVIAAIALVLPPLGAVAVWPLQFLLQPMVGFAQWIASWPSPSIDTGTASVLQCVGLYGVMLLLTFGNRWWPRLRLSTLQRTAMGVAGAIVILVAIPVLWPKPPLQVIALAAETPVFIARSANQTALINSGSAQTVQQVVLPFLRREGIRHIDRAFALADGNANHGWSELAQSVPISEIWTPERFAIASAAAANLNCLQQSGTELHGWAEGTAVTIGSTEWELVGDRALSFAVAGQRGLLVGTPIPAIDRLLRSHASLIPIDWLWWDGSSLSPDWLEKLQLRGGVVGGQSLHPGNSQRFTQNDIPLLWTDRVGAVLWQPQEIRLTRQDFD
ncbi:ComEC/Rec2 family competence protein [Synechococcus sp. PCC 7336]|uniref:ComEC/Rec2 family competence protein n=1 Tax=Synechococcus sp. PCC 7336 TaxID=195250 RepID=UPI0003452538|nr:ComEC/Rec2 family competence protein [Synechococcus sp. PCC 7336]